MRKKILSISMSLLFFCAINAEADEMSRLRVVADPWEPYTIGVPGKEAEGGFFPEIVKEACRRMGIEPQIVLYPWKRCLSFMETGDADVLMQVVKTPERETYMNFSDPVIVEKVVIAYAINRFPQGFSWKTIEDLKPYLVGITLGYSYGADVDKAMQDAGIETDEGKLDSMVIHKLAAGRTDIALIYKLCGKYWINKMNLEDKVLFAEPVLNEKIELYLGFSKKSAAASLVDKFNITLAAMKGDGTLDRLLER